MQIGLFASIFAREHLDDGFAAVRAHDVRAVQFDFACAGLPTLPEQIEPERCDRIRRAAVAHDVELSAISGTFNMIDPDAEKRQAGLARLETLIAACPLLGIPIVTLCTGTRDPHSMWRRHPDNATPEAWRDLLASLVEPVRAAEEAGVTLAFEPEHSNVVDSADKARRLLDEVRSPRLKVVIDPANIFHSGDLKRQGEVLDHAFDLLGDDIVLAHAKDLDHDGDAGNRPAGHGLLDYDHYATWLQRLGFQGAVVLHGLSEAEAPECLAFVRRKLTGHG